MTQLNELGDIDLDDTGLKSQTMLFYERQRWEDVSSRVWNSSFRAESRSHLGSSHLCWTLALFERGQGAIAKKGVTPGTFGQDYQLLPTGVTLCKNSLSSHLPCCVSIDDSLTQAKLLKFIQRQGKSWYPSSQILHLEIK